MYVSLFSLFYLTCYVLFVKFYVPGESKASAAAATAAAAASSCLATMQTTCKLNAKQNATHANNM